MGLWLLHGRAKVDFVEFWDCMTGKRGRNEEPKTRKNVQILSNKKRATGHLTGDPWNTSLKKLASGSDTEPPDMGSVQ